MPPGAAQGLAGEQGRGIVCFCPERPPGALTAREGLIRLWRKTQSSAFTTNWPRRRHWRPIPLTDGGGWGRGSGEGEARALSHHRVRDRSHRAPQGNEAQSRKTDLPRASRQTQVCRPQHPQESPMGTGRAAPGLGSHALCSLSPRVSGSTTMESLPRGPGIRTASHGR